MDWFEFALRIFLPFKRRRERPNRNGEMWNIERNCGCWYCSWPTSTRRKFGNKSVRVNICIILCVTRNSGKIVIEISQLNIMTAERMSVRATLMGDNVCTRGKEILGRYQQSKWASNIKKLQDFFLIFPTTFSHGKIRRKFKKQRKKK